MRRYFRQAELDDRVRYHEFSIGTRRTVDFDLVVKHVDEFSLKTLVAVAREGTDADQRKIVEFYFKHFAPGKLARLAEAGMFYGEGWNHTAIWLTVDHSSYYGTKKRRAFLQKLDRTKLLETLKILLDRKNDKSLIEDLVEQMQDEKIEIGDELTKAYLLSPEAKKELVINDSMSNEMKDFVADHVPYEMDHISTPTPHMMSRLFEAFGDIDENGKVNYFFTDIVKHWLGYRSYYVEKDGVVDTNVVRMLKAEAMRRKGVAIGIVVAILRRMAALAKKVQAGEQHLSFDSPKIRMVNPGWIPKKKGKKNFKRKTAKAPVIDDTQPSDDDDDNYYE